MRLHRIANCPNHSEDDVDSDYGVDAELLEALKSQAGVGAEGWPE